MSKKTIYNNLRKSISNKSYLRSNISAFDSWKCSKKKNIYIHVRVKKVKKKVRKIMLKKYVWRLGNAVFPGSKNNRRLYPFRPQQKKQCFIFLQQETFCLINSYSKNFLFSNLRFNMILSYFYNYVYKI